MTCIVQREKRQTRKVGMGICGGGEYCIIFFFGGMLGWEVGGGWGILGRIIDIGALEFSIHKVYEWGVWKEWYKSANKS